MTNLVKPRRGTRNLSKFLLCTAAALAIAPTAQAQDWTGAVSTDWFTAGNWNPAAVPSGGADANIDTTINAPVVGSGVAQPVLLWVGISNIGDLTITSGGTVQSLFGVMGFGAGSSGTIEVTGPNAIWNNNAQLFVGQDGSGTLTISAGGRVRDSGADVAYHPGSSGTILVTGSGSTWINDASVVVGEMGTGSLTVSDGASVTNGGTVLGLFNNSSGAVVVTGAGSTLTNNGGLFVGDSSTGTLTISDGGVVTSQSASLGFSFNGNGTALVTGAGSSWTNTGSLAVGDEGHGELTISEGAAVVGGTVLLGDSAGGSGVVSVTGQGSSLSGFVINVGAIGSGELSVADGGVISTNGILRIGDGSGIVTVGDGGQVLADTIQVGATGVGTLKIERGGSVVSTLSMGVAQGNGTTGTLTVAGGSLSAESIELGTNGDATLQITDGGTVTTNFVSGRVILGSTHGSGHVLVSGQGSTLTSGTFPGLVIGNGGEGDLAIADGGLVNAFDVTLGNNLGSTGRLVIGGDVTAAAPGTLNSFSVAFGAGDGSLVFNHTATDYVFTPGLTGTGFIDFQSGTTKLTGDSSGFRGNVLVDGGAAVFSGVASDWTLNNITVGDTGAGALTIEDGAVVTGDGPIGAAATASGSVLVTGAGSSWTGSAIDVGQFGHGELTVADGGFVSAQTIVGREVGSDGVALITGAGSTLQGLDAVGSHGDGRLTIADGATVFTLDPLDFFVGMDAGTTGEITVTGAGSRLLSFDSNNWIGASGTGSVTVADGAAYAAERIVLGANADGSGAMTVTGAGSTVDIAGNFFNQDLVVGDAGTGDLTIADGGTVDVSTSNPNGAFIVANQSGSTGAVLVTGAGSTLNTGFLTLIGAGGAGSLTIANGGAVRGFFNLVGTDSVFSADTSGSGTALVTGQDSLWDGAAFGVGNDVDGELTITNNGAVTASGAFGVAIEAGHAGAVTVSNHGQLTTPDLEVGIDGDGSLVISNDGVVTADLAIIGEDFGGTGAVSVTNNGSLTTQTLYVGLSGDGSLTIADGGKVASDAALVGGGTGRVLVTGAGSRWDIASSFALGSGDDGQLIVQNGGVVSTPFIELASFLGTTGVIVIGGESAPTAPGDLDATRIVFNGGDGALVFNHTSTNYTFASDLESAGSIGLVSFDAGVTKLTGDSSAFTGLADVHTGASAFFNNLFGGDVTVFGGGIVGGGGTVNQLHLLSGAVLAPGNSIGTLHAGSVDFAAGSIYRVEANAAGQSDLLQAGAVTIAGGTVAVTATAGAYAHATNYTIIDGPISGAFTNATSNIAFLIPSLSYDADSVVLTLTVDNHVFTNPNLTPNQAAVAAAISALPTDNPIFLGTVELSDANAAAAFNAYSGNFLAGLNGGGFNEPLQLFSTVQTRLLGMAEGRRAVQLASLADVGGASAERNGVWGQIFGGVSSLDGDANTTGIDFTRGGLIFGADRPVGADARVGVSASYQHTGAEAAGRVADGDVDSYGLALYGGARAGALSLMGEIGYSFRDVTTRRHVVVGTTDQTLHADYNANGTHAQLRVGLPLQRAGGVIEPFAALAFVQVNTDSFTETGGSAALTSDDSDSSVVFSSLGVRLTHDLGPDGRNGGFYGSLAWRHASGDVAPEQRFAFASDPSATFAVKGAPIAEDAAALEAGARVVLGPRTNMTIGYRGEFGDGSQDHTASVRFAFTH